MAVFWSVAATAACFKLLLLPSYKSTDFNVHRNWLAVTHSLPVRKWYYEDTSEWTLDYPPLFAWFEYFLSLLAVFFDPVMLKVENIDYASEATVVFQRLTVVLTDLVYIYAVKQIYDFFSSMKAATKDEEDILHSSTLVQATVLLTNFGLIIIDHIHFQYNGFLYGILMLSVVRIFQGRHLSAAFWFATLLNFKHIYLYIAPAYFIYLLRCYVFSSNEDGSLRWRSFSILRLFGLGVVVIAVFTVSLGPFMLLGQVPQVLSRLFPFKRGLCHAYWAPNFWALYNIADKALALAGSRLGLVDVGNQTASLTGGLVQTFEHTVLPSITPIVTMILAGLAILPGMLMLWIRPKGPQSFVRGLILCAFGSFMFGWHVHEKAILMITIPMSLLILEKKNDATLYLLMSSIGHYSLFPLFFTQFETPIKVGLLAMTCLYAFISLGNVYRSPGSSVRLPLMSQTETLYLLGVVPLELYNSVGHYVLGLSSKLPFLPLMLTSVYCSIGVTYCWLRFYWISYQDVHKHGKQS